MNKINDGASSGNLRHENSPFISDGFGVDMFKRFWRFHHRVNVHTAFMRKSRPADERLSARQRKIGNLRNTNSRAGELFHAFFGDTCIIQLYL